MQKYININMQLIQFISTMDKPNNNVVYVFEYCYFLKMPTDGSRYM